MGATNAAWHRAPPRATPDERIAWHVEHAAHCACRSIPESVRADLRARVVGARSSSLASGGHSWPTLNARRIGRRSFRPRRSTRPVISNACHVDVVYRAQRRSATVIPNLVHFIYGMRDDGRGGASFGFSHYLAVATAREVHRPDQIIFHYAFEPTGEWWDRARPLVTPRHVDPPDRIFGRPVDHYAHRADVLRLEVLIERGGIYLDVDVLSLRPFASLRHSACVMGQEAGTGLCNAVILAEPGAPFLRRWYDEYRTFRDDEWNEHSVKLPARLRHQYPDLIHVEGPYAFFYPLFDDPTAAWLWGASLPARRYYTRVSIEGHLSRLIGRRSPRPPVPLMHLLGGPSWQYRRLQQSYCIHLWQSLWQDRLNIMTPDWVRRSDGTLARRLRDVLSPETLAAL